MFLSFFGHQIRKVSIAPSVIMVRLVVRLFAAFWKRVDDSCGKAGGKELEL